METRNILTVAYFVLAIYMYGGGVMSTLVYYQSWRLVGEDEFAAVHSSVSRRILPSFGPVLVLLALVNILLIWSHHPAISKWLIVLTALIHLFMVVVRFAVFVPIHASRHEVTFNRCLTAHWERGKSLSTTRLEPHCSSLSRLSRSLLCDPV
jgi:hypothetical protein